MVAGAATIGLLIYMILSFFVSSKASGVNDDLEELISSVRYEVLVPVAVLMPKIESIHASSS